MATNLDIIKRALRKLHVLASGTDPSSAQSADAMDALQSLLVEMIGKGGLGRLADVVVPDTETSYDAFGWSRVKYPSGCTVTLPTYGGDTFDNTNDTCQSFHDLAPIVKVSAAGVAVYYIFNAYGTGWTAINDLALTDTFPMAAHYENGFAAMLAESLAEEYEATPGPLTVRDAAWCRHALASKRDSEDNVSPEPNEYY